jgi:hypothetical protein
MYIKDSKEGHDYACVEVKDGKIVSIDVGNFREGGLIWHKNWENEPNGNKLACMQYNIAKKWPHIYEQVRENCPLENLPTLKATKKMLLERDLKSVNEEIDVEERSLQELIRKRAKIRNALIEVKK